MTRNQFYNLLAFLVVLANEDVQVIGKLSPDYIVEKYARYISAPPRDDDMWMTGLHPALRENVMGAYQRVWARQLAEMFPETVDA